MKRNIGYLATETYSELCHRNELDTVNNTNYTTNQGLVFLFQCFIGGIGNIVCNTKYIIVFLTDTQTKAQTVIYEIVQGYIQFNLEIDRTKDRN